MLFETPSGSRGALAQWLAYWPLDGTFWVLQALARVIVLCSWAGHLNLINTLTVPLSTIEFNARGNPSVD